MERTNAYYYPNLIEVQCNPDPLITARHKIMYQRKIKLYKGVQNLVQFLFKNADQKPVNVTGWTITFNMMSDYEGILALSKPATVVNAIGGLVTVSVSEFDLIDLVNNRYSYALTVTDPNGIEQVVYSDDNYDVRGEVILTAGPYPELKNSILVDLPTNSNTNVITSSLVADKGSRQQSANHSAQFYFNNFTGNITVQGTLDSLPPTGNVAASTLSWGTISNLQYTNQALTDYHNFTGVYTAVRFVVAPTNGNVNPSPVTKILYRS